MRVRYSARSIEALDEIRRYISNDNPNAAWVVASFIRQTIRHLEVCRSKDALPNERTFGELSSSTIRMSSTTT